MNPPTCKLCESRHWLDEEHKPSPALDKVQKVGAGVLRNTVTKPEVILGAGGRDFKMSPPDVPTPPPDVPTVSLQECECGKPREGRYKKCAACRKAAYRERSRG